MIEERPLFTFMLVAYNQECFIAEAVKGAFNQTYSPLEIILSDDCSPDRTFEIMQEMAAQYQGPHNIVLHRNEHNLGLVGHINRLMEIAKGKMIIVAAGDDISLPERTANVFEVFEASGRMAYCIFSRKWMEIDQNGVTIKEQILNLPADELLDPNFFGRKIQFVPGHSNAWHREVFDVFGPINTKVISEDTVIPFRATLLGKIASINSVQVMRRIHTFNISRPSNKAKLRERIDWYKNNFVTGIMNREGILETFLQDMQKLQICDYEKQSMINTLKHLLQHNLEDQKLEKKFARSSTISRIAILKEAINHNTSWLRLIRWIFQYWFPTINYMILKSPIFIPLYRRLK